jgi:hypothetical protein
MSTLTGQYISQSYGGLIKLSTNTGIAAGTSTQLEDGVGTSLGIYFKTGGQINATGYTGSLAGTASFANFVVSSSYANVAGNAITSNFATTAGSVTNGVYTNSANIFTAANTFSGSIKNKVTTLTVSSNTASMDLSSGNLFTLTLISGSTIYLNPTNIQLGQTTMLQIVQVTGGGGNLSYGSNITFPASFPYTPSTGSSVVDTISMISFNGTNLRAVQAYNFV